MIQTDYDAGRAAFLAGKDDFDDHPMRESESNKARSDRAGGDQIPVTVPAPALSFNAATPILRA